MNMFYQTLEFEIFTTSFIQDNFFPICLIDIPTLNNYMFLGLLKFKQ